MWRVTLIPKEWSSLWFSYQLGVVWCVYSRWYVMCDMYLCAFTFWHKLYADEPLLLLGFFLKNQNLKKVLNFKKKYYVGKTLRWIDNKNQLQASFSLFNEVTWSFMWLQVVNPKKCALFAIKNHCKLSEDRDLKGIPVVTEYCCQIVVINNLGSIAPQIDSIRCHCNYLQANMR
jgi:hypothetical protein